MLSLFFPGIPQAQGGLRVVLDIDRGSAHIAAKTATHFRMTAQLASRDLVCNWHVWMCRFRDMISNIA